MTAALAGKQSTIEVGTGGPPPDTWTAIEEVYDIGELPIERATYDVTSHGSSYYREFISGLYVIPQLTMGANYVETQYDTLFSELGTDAIGYYRLRYPDDTTHEFQAIITSVTPVTPLDDRLTYNLTLTISGVIARGTAI